MKSIQYDYRLLSQFNEKQVHSLKYKSTISHILLKYRLHIATYNFLALALVTTGSHDAMGPLITLHTSRIGYCHSTRAY